MRTTGESDPDRDVSQEMETEEVQEWSSDDLQKLLLAIKENIPEKTKKFAYNQAQMKMDWSLVAFHPYSPEECKTKWIKIMQKMRKVRTLPDLIDEAQDAICNRSSKNWKIHPCCPKKPVPPNSIYFQEKQAKLKKKFPHLDFGALMKKANKKFSQLPADKKEKYINTFKRASKEYEEKMKQFRSQYYKDKSYRKRKKSGNEQQPEVEGTTESSTPVKPPPNSYTLFCKDQWAAREGITNSNFIAVCGKRWRELDKETKIKYQQRFQKMKNLYQQDISAEGWRVKKKENSTKLAEMFQNEPKKPTQSGHVLFCREHMDLLKAEVPEITKRLSVVSPLWQALSSPDKDHYRNMAADNFMKYTVELKKWFEKLSSEKKAAYRTHKPLNCEIIDLDIEALRKSKPKRVPKEEEAAKENLNMVTGKADLKQSRPSDSEDEDYDDYSSDDEDYDSTEDEDDDDEEEEEEDGMMFEAC